MTGNRGEYFRVVVFLEKVEKEGDIFSLLPISKSTSHQLGLLLAEKYDIPLMGGSCPQG